MTAKTVADGNKMDNESLGALTRRFREIERRVDEGTLHFEDVMWRLQNIVEGKDMVFPIWRTITLGLHKTPDEYRKALKSAGRRINNWGDDILGRISCSQEEIDLDLVVLSVGDLGFKGIAGYADICAKAVELGLRLCPAEVGPALRLQYGDQPSGEWLRIAIQVITDRGGGHNIFGVEHGNDDLWLGAEGGHPGSVWYADNRFVFVQPKRSR